MATSQTREATTEEQELRKLLAAEADRLSVEFGRHYITASVTEWHFNKNGGHLSWTWLIQRPDSSAENRGVRCHVAFGLCTLQAWSDAGQVAWKSRGLINGWRVPRLLNMAFGITES